MAVQKSGVSKSTGKPLPVGVAQADPADRAREVKPARRRAAAHSEGDAAKPTEQAPQRTEVSHQARYMMIQEAAYLRAERRGFQPGFELDDWLAAENEVDTLLGASHGSAAQ